jgi:hypothetical protein
VDLQVIGSRESCAFKTFTQPYISYRTPPIECCCSTTVVAVYGALQLVAWSERCDNDKGHVIVRSFSICLDTIGGSSLRGYSATLT